MSAAAEALAAHVKSANDDMLVVVLGELAKMKLSAEVSVSVGAVLDEMKNRPSLASVLAQLEAVAIEALSAAAPAPLYDQPINRYHR